MEGNYSKVEWGPRAYCPQGSFAFAFRLKVRQVRRMERMEGRRQDRKKEG
ncbi:hypothetical protein E2C01_044351 [Portunus trituberculatus]|uniref:Uncharacterized protein n=1 Tax=Portunus trituberculatus TaxID=210409 RepID=A0A5B7FVE0_PORTR|nr:hypothetical protein [Portunus trituberculatus]